MVMKNQGKYKRKKVKTKKKRPKRMSGIAFGNQYINNLLSQRISCYFFQKLRSFETKIEFINFPPKTFFFFSFHHCFSSEPPFPGLQMEVNLLSLVPSPSLQTLN